MQVCKAAVLTGDVTIGEGCIIHPTAHITAVDGPIVIGQFATRSLYPTHTHARASTHARAYTRPANFTFV